MLRATDFECHKVCATLLGTLPAFSKVLIDYWAAPGGRGQTPPSPSLPQRTGTSACATMDWRSINHKVKWAHPSHGNVPTKGGRLPGRQSAC
jgi:hypothetical protein